MRGGSSTVRLEMEHHNFDNETNEEIERDAHGLCVMSDGCETLYQPWGAHGRPLTNPLLSAFNVSVWLLYKMTAMICLPMQFWKWFCGCHCRQMLRGTCFFSHCASNIVCLVTRLCSIWKAGATGAGLAQPGEVQTPAETMVSRTSLVLVRPTLASALVHLGFPRCFAVHLPNSIGAGNRTLWRGNWVLVPCLQECTAGGACFWKKSPPPKQTKLSSLLACCRLASTCWSTKAVSAPGPQGCHVPFGVVVFVGLNMEMHAVKSCCYKMGCMCGNLWLL